MNQESISLLDELGLSTAGPRTREVARPTPVATAKPTPPVRVVKPSVTKPAAPVRVVKPAVTKPATPARAVKPAPTAEPVKILPKKRVASPKPAKVEKLPEPVELITQEDVYKAYERAVSNASQNFASHVYGADSTGKTKHLVELLRKEDESSLILVCYPPRSRNIPLSRPSGVEGVYSLKVKEYNLDTDRVIYADTTSAKNLVLECHNRDLRMPTWIVVDSWNGDIDSHVICTLPFALSQGNAPGSAVIICSLSLHSHIPPIRGNDREEIPSVGRQIVYINDDQVALTLSRAQGKVALFTSEERVKKYTREGLSVFTSAPRITDTATYDVVVDDLYRKKDSYNTLLSHDVIANTVTAGTVYRVSTQEDALALPAHMKPTWPARDLGEASKFLTAAGIEADKFLSTVGSERINYIQRAFKERGIEQKDVKAVNRYKLSPSAVALFCKHPDARKNTRAGYVVRLVCCVMSLDVKQRSNELTEFAGRNDLDTLINMWQSLALADYTKPFHKWVAESVLADKWFNSHYSLKEAAWQLLETMSSMAKGIGIYSTSKAPVDVTSKELTTISKYLYDSDIFVNPKGDIVPESNIPHKVKKVKVPGLRVPFESSKYPSIVLGPGQLYTPYVMPKEEFDDL